MESSENLEKDSESFKCEEWSLRDRKPLSTPNLFFYEP